MTDPKTTEPMAWSDQYLLGYPAMDRTHQEFVDCVAALQRADDAELPARLQAFADHAVAHFRQEEQWMAATDFPAMQCHADEHAAVLSSVREVQALLSEQGDCDVVRRLVQALVDWFPAHADYLDAALSHWMAKRSHGGAPVVIRRGMASPASN